MFAGLGPSGALAGAQSFMPGEWDWMQSPMFAQALMGAGGMFQQPQQQQPMMPPPQLGPMPMGRTIPIQAPSLPQTPFQMRQPLYGGMFSG